MSRLCLAVVVAFNVASAEYSLLGGTFLRRASFDHTASRLQPQYEHQLHEEQEAMLQSELLHPQEQLQPQEIEQWSLPQEQKQPQHQRQEQSPGEDVRQHIEDLRQLRPEPPLPRGGRSQEPFQPTESEQLRPPREQEQQLDKRQEAERHSVRLPAVPPLELRVVESPATARSLELQPAEPPVDLSGLEAPAAARPPPERSGADAPAADDRGRPGPAVLELKEGEEVRHEQHTIRIVSKLQHGSHGEVFLGELRPGLGQGTPRYVAVKQLKHKDSWRLQHEYAMLRKFESRSFVRPLETIEDRMVLVLEYAKGDLYTEAYERLSKRAPFQMSTVLRFMRGLLSGLAAMHERGYAHRDIKPENLLLFCTGDQESDCELRIADLELACNFQRTDEGHECKRAAGSIEFQAPEVDLTSRAVYTLPMPGIAKQDMWCTGLVLKLLLCGDDRANARCPRPHPHIRTEMGKRLAVVMRQMLRSDPAVRWNAERCLAVLSPPPRAKQARDASAARPP